MSKRALGIFGGAFVAATAAVIVSGPASASPQEPGYDSTGSDSYRNNNDTYGRVSVNVEFQREDLKSGAGAEHVYRKIRDAAQSACGEPSGWIYELQRQIDIQKCERDAIANAVERINAPELTDIYELNAPNHPLPSPG